MRKWIPTVKPDDCKGCGLCATVCRTGCLAIRDGVGVLARPGACTSGARCVPLCPTGALHMKWVPIRGDRSIGRWL